MEQKTEIKEQAPVTILDDYSVIVSKQEALQGFFTEGKNLDNLYGVIEGKAKALVADPTTKEGASQIKSAARQLASVKVKVDNLGKQVVAELKKLPGVIDDNRKAFREKMEALQEEIRRPVTEIEERHDKVIAIKEIHAKCIDMDSKALEEKISEIASEKEKANEKDWKESFDEAVKAYEGEIAALNTMKAAAEKREEDARQLAELKAKQEEAERIIREQKIREEAERRAKEQAEAQAAAEREAEARKNQAASIDFPVFQGAEVHYVDVPVQVRTDEPVK